MWVRLLVADVSATIGIRIINTGLNLPDFKPHHAVILGSVAKYAWLKLDQNENEKYSPKRVDGKRIQTATLEMANQMLPTPEDKLSTFDACLSRIKGISEQMNTRLTSLETRVDNGFRNPDYNHA